jgi:hypothetical protein
MRPPNSLLATRHSELASAVGPNNQDRQIDPTPLGGLGGLGLPATPAKFLSGTPPNARATRQRWRSRRHLPSARAPIAHSRSNGESEATRNREPTLGERTPHVQQPPRGDAMSENQRGGGFLAWITTRNRYNGPVVRVSRTERRRRVRRTVSWMTLSLLRGRR